MKTLNDILTGIRIEQVAGDRFIIIEAVHFDSRKVVKNSLFVAIKGTQVDGHRFIAQAIDKGATAIVCEHLPELIHEHITYILTSNSSEALGYACSNFFDNPSRHLKLIGITGTNGKTTIATLLFRLFQSLGYKTGLLSTVQNQIGQTVIPATHTTPDARSINAMLHKMVNHGCDYCFMEVSSHAIDQNRVAGLYFTAGVFTNLTHDHLDYHKDFNNYLKSKKKLFDHLPEEALAIVNLDDKNGRIITQNCKAHVHTFGIDHMADFHGKILENTLQGLHLQISGEDVWFQLVGRFNASNLMAVYASAISLGQNKQEVLSVLSNLRGAEGRFDRIEGAGGISLIIDYAHTPDALKKVLETINELRTGNETLITVVGAGGNRDKLKRPLMGKIAASLSDKVILTSDNPRMEDPELIIQDMIQGISTGNLRKTIKILNRAEALKTASLIASSGDIILVTGKGHEKYQEIKGVRHPFDDRKILEDLIMNQNNK